ncbi:MAG: OadG family protein [Paludibacteraceae bacterium]|nr:OadG family protein [Paludibacteraceae bacterium]
MILLAVNWPHVWMVTLLGFAIVLILLVVLIYVLKLFGFIMRPRVKVENPHEVHEAVGAPRKQTSEKITLTGNATAAIAMALHLYYNGVHDEEPTQVTIKKVERKYSPWNSKLYGMNNLHRS